jgi:hypothetical protein
LNESELLPGLISVKNHTHLKTPFGNKSTFRSAHEYNLVKEIQDEVKDAIQEGIKEAERKDAATATDEFLPGDDVVTGKGEDEHAQGWRALKQLLYAGRRKDYSVSTGGAKKFITSVGLPDWVVLGGFVALFNFQHMHSMFTGQTTSSRTYHVAALLFWVLVGCLYAVFVGLRMGIPGGVLFLNGFTLELVFLVENVFVAQIILSAFRMPRWANNKALHILSNCRIVFQFFFYMGLVQLLFGGHFLPYSWAWVSSTWASRRP